MMFLLDTDHVSLDQRGHAGVRMRMQAVEPHQIALSIITVEEQMRGWLAAIRSTTNAVTRATAYQRLHMAVAYFASLAIIDYTAQIDQDVQDLRKQGLRIGTQDLRIAATARALGAVLVTRNHVDFSQVPDLRLEDWSI